MAPSFIAMDDATGAETPDSSSLFKSTRITQCGVMPLQCAGVEVSNKLNATCTVVKVMAQDRPRLLLDLAAFFQRSAHNVVEADVTTSPTSEMASDIFLVQQSDGRKKSGQNCSMRTEAATIQAKSTQEYLKKQA